MIHSFFTGASNITSGNTKNYNNTLCDTNKRQSKRINTLMFGTIGLAALSFIILAATVLKSKTAVCLIYLNLEIDQNCKHMVIQILLKYKDQVLIIVFVNIQ